jgi:hypothetical protein
MRTGTSVILSSGQLALTDGGSAIAPSSQLIPPFRRPYLIHEVRFTAKSRQIGVAVGVPTPTDAQMFYQVKLTLGAQHGLTDGFVPISILAPSVQTAAEEMSAAQGISAGQAKYQYGSMLRWKLPRPMYVGAGSGLQAQFQRPVDSGGGTGSIEMVVVGEVLPDGYPAPRTSLVPWVGTYSNPKLAASQSSALNLQNPFNDRNLYLQRLIGRAYMDAGTGFYFSAALNFTEGEASYTFPYGSINPPFSGMTLTVNPHALVALMDQDRNPITPVEGLAFGEAFDARTHALRHERPLGPKEYLQARFWSGPNDQVYWIGMIGWREEIVS